MAHILTGTRKLILLASANIFAARQEEEGSVDLEQSIKKMNLLIVEVTMHSFDDIN